MRVITFIKSDLVAVMKIVEKEFEVLEGPDDKAKKLSIHEFGYRSIHYIVKLNQKRAELPECREYKDFRAEIQIRTIIENAWAEIEHHWNYKPDNKDDQLDETFQRRLNGLMAVLELVDREFDSIRDSFQDKFKSDEIMLNTISELARSPDLFEDICKYLFDNERYEELVYFTKEAVINDEKNRKAFTNMAIGLINLDNYEETLEIFENLINLEPNIAIHYIGKGYAFSRLDKHAKALICYDKALKLETNNTLALVNKGAALAKLGKHKEALEWIDKTLTLEPEYAYALDNKGLVLYNLKKYEEAIQFFDKVLELEPENAETLVNKGAALAKLGKPEEAIQLFDKVLDFEPENILALIDKTLALADLGKHEEALEWIDIALKHEPENLYALANKVRLLYGLGKYEEEIKLFVRVLKDTQEEFIPPYNKELILYILGIFEKVIQLSNKELEPEQENIQTSMGISLAELGKHKEAIKWFNSVLKHNPKNKIALIGKSIALEKSEKYEDALNPLKIILHNNPDDKFVLYLLARIQSLIGNDKLALKFLASAINLDEQYKSKAKDDNAFEIIKGKKEFKKLTS